jgi:hypothetical protein
VSPFAILRTRSKRGRCESAIWRRLAIRPAIRASLARVPCAGATPSRPARDSATMPPSRIGSLLTPAKQRCSCVHDGGAQTPRDINARCKSRYRGGSSRTSYRFRTWNLLGWPYCSRIPFLVVCAIARNKAASEVFESQFADRVLTEDSVTHTSRGNTHSSSWPYRTRWRQRTCLAEECSS